MTRCGFHSRGCNVRLRQDESAYLRCDLGAGADSLCFRHFGKGIILIDASERNGPVVDIRLVGESDEVMLITDKGQTLRTRIAEIRETGRNAQGVKIMSVEADERVSALERLAEGPPGASEAPEGSMSPPDGDGAATPEPPETSDDDKSLN